MVEYGKVFPFFSTFPVAARRGTRRGRFCLQEIISECRGHTKTGQRTGRQNGAENIKENDEKYITNIYQPCRGVGDGGRETEEVAWVLTGVCVFVGW